MSSAYRTGVVRPRSAVPSQSMRYGLGFWLNGSGEAVRLEGCDTGASFRSWHHPTPRLTHTVIGNDMDCAWPMTKALYARLSAPLVS